MGEVKYWEVVEIILDNMVKGGIYDYVGGGFV